MKLIKPSYQILKLDDGETILKDIEIAARTCYQSDHKIEYEDLRIISDKIEDNEYIKDYYAKSARVLIPKLIARGHFAMLEFADMTVKFICDRGVSHELVRHRLCSFAQESTRYCNYGKDEHISFIIPSWLELDRFEYSFADTSMNSDNPKNHWLQSMLQSEYHYNGLLAQGWSPQQARSVLPNSLKTEIIVKANLREWREIFRQRTANAAHPDMRAIMHPLLDEVKSKVPIIFDDINY